MSYTMGDIVVCLRVSPNLGGHGTPGRWYRVCAIRPKVRITPGTGRDFLVCQDIEYLSLTTPTVHFNLTDVTIVVKRIKKERRNRRV